MASVLNRSVLGPRLEQTGSVLLAVVVTLTLIAASFLWLATRGQSSMLMQESRADVDVVREVHAAALAHAASLASDGSCPIDQTLGSVGLGEHQYSIEVKAGGDRQVVSVTPAQDTYIEEKSPDKSNPDHGDLHIDLKKNQQQHALLSFDLSTIATDRVVQTATLWLYAHEEDSDAPVTLHENTLGFSEDTATWNTHSDEFQRTSVAALMPTTANGHWMSVPITATAQRWVNNPSANLGLRLLASSDAMESKVTSKEHGTSANRPYLEVVHADAIASRATATIDITLANGTTMSDLSHELPLLQAEQSMVVEPESEGVDAWFDDSNNGDAKTLEVSDSPQRMAAFRFDVGSIPLNATVTQATLSLYTTDESTPGTIEAEAFTSDWTESGITRTQARFLDPWARSNGEVDRAMRHSATSPGKNQWLDFDLTESTQRWVNGAPNYGIRLSTEDANVSFSSSDDNNKNRRWKFAVHYACACGTTCVVSSPSSGATADELLFIVDNSLSLTEEEQVRQDMFQAWGYDVTLVSDTTFDFLTDVYLSGKDVVFVSAAARADSVRDLDDTSVSVVSEHPDAMDEIRIALSTSGESENALTIDTTAHPITAAFPLSATPLAEVSIALLSMNTPAEGAQILGSVSGRPSLLALPAGEIDTSGAAATSNRVALPFGTNTRLQNLNSNAQLLIQSALKWAADGEVIESFCNADFSPNAVEQSISPSTPGIDDVTWVPEGAALDKSTAPAGGAWVVTDRDNARLRMIADDGSLIDEVDTPTDDPAGASYVAEGKYAGSWVYVDWWDERLVFMDSDGDRLARYDTDDAGMISTTGVSYVGTTLSAKFDEHVVVVDQWTGLVAFYDQEGAVQHSFTLVDSEEPNGIVHLPGTDKLLVTYPSSRRITDMDGNLIRQYTAGQPADGTGIAIHGETCQHVLADSNAGTIKFLEQLPQPNARWEFNEGTGGIATDTIGGREATLKDTTWAPSGIVGSALSFNSVSSAAAVPEDPSLALDRNFTLSAWIYPAAVTERQGIISNDSYFQFGLKGDELVLTQTGAVQDNVVSSGAAIADSAWTYVVATVDTDGTVTLYANSVDVGSGSFSDAAATTSSDLLIGVNHDDDVFDGVLDDLRIYDEAIDASTITKEYTNASPPTGSGPFCSAAGDDFQTGDWTGSTGPMAWRNDWQEVNEDGNVFTGDEVVGQPGNSLVARIRDNDGGGEGIERGIDLSGQATATLAFEYWRWELEADDYAMVLYSGDAGGSWTEIQRIQGPGTDTITSSGITSSLVLPTPLTADSMIRFLTWSGMGGNDRVYFDNVSITTCP